MSKLRKKDRVKAYRAMMVTETGEWMSLAEAKLRVEVHGHNYSDDALRPYLLIKTLRYCKDS